MFLINASWTATQNDAAGVEMFNLLPGCLGRDEFTIDVEFSYTTGYQTAVLRPEIHDKDGLSCHVLMVPILTRRGLATLCLFLRGYL
jgi:hypothetical protein